MLLVVRVGIAVISGSLSIIVTTLDAVLDVISGFIIWFTAQAVQDVNKYKYPIGKVSSSYRPYTLNPGPNCSGFTLNWLTAPSKPLSQFVYHFC